MHRRHELHAGLLVRHDLRRRGHHAATKCNPCIRLEDPVERPKGKIHPDELVDRLAGLDTVPPTAPRLYAGGYDEHRLIAVSGGREEHLREGIVVRPVLERHSPVVGRPAIDKRISEAYLTRHGGTEYE